jgi:hypothetical protein
MRHGESGAQVAMNRVVATIERHRTIGPTETNHGTLRDRCGANGVLAASQIQRVSRSNHATIRFLRVRVVRDFLLAKIAETFAVGESIGQAIGQIERAVLNIKGAL